MKKFLLVAPFLAAFQNQVMANETDNMEISVISTEELSIVSNVDELIINEIIVNRGNCRGWSLNSEIERLESSIKEAKERNKGNKREKGLTNIYFMFLDKWEPILAGLKQNKGAKLVYGQQQGFGYSCPNGVPREVTVKLADGTEGVFKFR